MVYRKHFVAIGLLLLSSGILGYRLGEDSTSYRFAMRGYARLFLPDNFEYYIDFGLMGEEKCRRRFARGDWKEVKCIALTYEVYDHIEPTIRDKVRKLKQRVVRGVTAP